MSYQPWRISRLHGRGSDYWSYCITWLDETGQPRHASLRTTDWDAAEDLARDFWAWLTKPLT